MTAAAADIIRRRYAALDQAADDLRVQRAQIAALPPHERRLRAASAAILRRAEQGPATLGELRSALSNRPYRADGLSPRDVFDEALKQVADQLAEVDDGRRATRWTLAELVP